MKLPANLTLLESMIYGTAGLTAGLCADAIAESSHPKDGEILVTGASGGVGCLTVAILAKLGYSVVAVSGKRQATGFLLQLGATQIIHRNDATDTSGRALLNARWAGVVDTVGGDILTTAIREAKRHATIACCGNVASPDMHITVFPFILRGVTLKGITAQHASREQRMAIWNRLSTEWKIDQFTPIYTGIPLEQLDDMIDRILQGTVTGRTVVIHENKTDALVSA